MTPRPTITNAAIRNTSQIQGTRAPIFLHPSGSVCLHSYINRQSPASPHDACFRCHSTVSPQPHPLCGQQQNRTDGNSTPATHRAQIARLRTVPAGRNARGHTGSSCQADGTRLPRLKHTHASARPSASHSSLALPLVLTLETTTFPAPDFCRTSVPSTIRLHSSLRLYPSGPRKLLP